MLRHFRAASARRFGATPDGGAGWATHTAAIGAAGVYWFGVGVAYLTALIAHDRSGLAFLPFTFLSLPWSILLYPLVSQIPAHGIAAAAYAISCVVLSSINAVVVYSLIRGSLAVAAKIMSTRRK